MSKGEEGKKKRKMIRKMLSESIEAIMNEYWPKRKEGQEQEAPHSFQDFKEKDWKKLKKYFDIFAFLHLEPSEIRKQQHLTYLKKFDRLIKGNNTKKPLCEKWAPFNENLSNEGRVKFLNDFKQFLKKTDTVLKKNGHISQKGDITYDDFRNFNAYYITSEEDGEKHNFFRLFTHDPQNGNIKDYSFSFVASLFLDHGDEKGEKDTVPHPQQSTSLLNWVLTTPSKKMTNGIDYDADDPNHVKIFTECLAQENLMQNLVKNLKGNDTPPDLFFLWRTLKLISPLHWNKHSEKDGYPCDEADEDEDPLITRKKGNSLKENNDQLEKLLGDKSPLTCNFILEKHTVANFTDSNAGSHRVHSLHFSDTSTDPGRTHNIIVQIIATNHGPDPSNDEDMSKVI
jgi:hypothetical protein